MQDHLHHVQEIAPNATLGEHTVWYKWVCIIVQMGDDYYPNGGRIITQMRDALSYKWGTLLLCKAEGNKPRGTSVASGAEPL